MVVSGLQKNIELGTNMENLFEISKENWELERKVRKMRAKLREKTLELAIQPDHDEFGHFYKFEGKRYPSVTGRLQILKDPGLMNWKMNRALDHIAQQIKYDAAKTPKYWLEIEDIAALLEAAKMVPQLEFEGAGNIGTIVHNWREDWFSNVIDKGFELSNIPALAPGSDPRVQSATRAIQKFVKECNYMPVACELFVADHTLETGGQVDDIGFVNGELALVDLKTSNIGDKESYYAQVALYLFMFQKLYRVRPKKLYILHASKTDGTYKLITIPDPPGTIKWAKKVVEVSKGLDLIKQSKKKTVINI